MQLLTILGIIVVVSLFEGLLSLSVGRRASGLFSVIAFWSFAVTIITMSLGSVLLAVVVFSLPMVNYLSKITVNYLLGQLALRGFLSTEKQWLAELIVEGDEEFKEALGNIDYMRHVEIRKIAESKEEYRERVVNAYRNAERFK